jgi:lysophospholipase
MSPPAEFYNGFHSNLTTANPSPTASTYNLALQADSAAVDGLDGLPESRVLIIMTGGTICMRRSENGYVPAKGFMDACLKPRPSFNDASPTKQVPVVQEDGSTLMTNTLSRWAQYLFAQHGR